MVLVLSSILIFEVRMPVVLGFFHATNLNRPILIG
jgi:hypothetical protein